VEQEPDWVLGVVRHWEGLNRHVTDIKLGSRHENAAVAFGIQLPLDGILGEAIAVNRDLQLRAERHETLNVISMLVGDQNGVQRFGSAPQAGQALPDLASAKASVD
jgi:hypothetical protein